MNKFEENKKIIEVLESQLARLNATTLDAEGRATRDELIEEIQTRKRQPAGAPLSMQGYRTQSGRSSGPFPTAGEQYRAIADAARPGGQVDPRLYDVRAATGLSESVPSDGGFLLQQQYTNDILTNVYATGKIASLCRRIQLSGNANSISIPGLDETSRVAGSRWGGVQSYWINEAAEITKSKPKFRLLQLNLKKQCVLVYVTDELLQDVTVLEAVVQRMASDELSFTLEDAIINGTGATMPLGILNSGSLISVTKEAGQKASTLVLENVVKMWSRMIGSSRQNAVWLINQSIEPQLYTMSLSVGTGGAPVFMPAGGAAAQPYMTLFGRPVIATEQCPQLGTLGDIIFADLAGGYILAEKGGVQSAASIHIQFQYDQSVFRFIMRVDGQPVLSQPITPFKGGSTLSQSHFVALESRL